MTLLDSQCRGTKAGDKIKKLSDGGGLHLAILPSGSKLWRIAYRVDGAQKTHHLGAYPAVTLGEARELRNAFKTSLRGGDVSTATAPARNTFRSVAEEWYEREAGS